MSRDLIIVQSGGPTAVINATLAEALRAARDQGSHWSSIWGARHAYEGLSAGELCSLSALSDDQQQLAQLAETPGSILGSTRKPADLDGIAQALAARSAPTDLLLIGGNGTTWTGKQLVSRLPADCRLVVAPKTVDNDLADVAFAPGYGSAAQFIGGVARAVGADHRGMQTFDHVTIIESMGRDSGWLALAASAYRETDFEPPHITLLPEFPLNETALFDRVAQVRAAHGYAIIAVNEALKLPDARYYGQDQITGPRDDLGRPVFSLSSGTGAFLAARVSERLGLQCRTVRPGTFGRAATGYRSKRDFDLARAAGRHAVEALVAEDTAQLITVSATLQVGTQPLLDAKSDPRLVTSREYDLDGLRPTESFLRGLRMLIDPAKPFFAG